LEIPLKLAKEILEKVMEISFNSPLEMQAGVPRGLPALIPGCFNSPLEMLKAITGKEFHLTWDSFNSPLEMPLDLLAELPILPLLFQFSIGDARWWSTCRPLRGSACFNSPLEMRDWEPHRVTGYAFL